MVVVRIEAVLQHHFAMVSFERVEFLLLLRSEKGSDVLFRFLHYQADALGRFQPDRFEFRAGRLNDGRDFRFLFRSQVQTASHVFAHPVANFARLRWPENHMVANVMETEERTRRSARDENEEERECELPFQGAVHGENSVWMAVSAMAYSFV